MVEGSIFVLPDLHTFYQTKSEQTNFFLVFFHNKKVTGVAKRGGYRYDDGTRYIGDWNSRGQKHGMGHLILAGKLNLQTIRS